MDPGLRRHPAQQTHDLHRRVYLLWLRPGGFGLTIVLFAVYELLAPMPAVRELLPAVGLLLVTSPALVLLGQRAGLLTATRIALAADAVLIAYATSLFPRPEPGAIGYVWVVFAAAYLLGARDIALYTGLTIVGAVAVPALAVPDTNWLNVVSNVLALVLLGGLAFLLVRQARRAEDELARAHALDGHVLAIADELRFAHELQVRLPSALRRMRDATNAASVRLRLAEPGEDVAGDKEYAVGGAPGGVVERLAREVSWHGRRYGVLELVGEGRGWAAAARPLVDRTAPQFGATLAEAEILRKREGALRKLEELDRLRRELVANVSHELRTPVTSILGFLLTVQRPEIVVDAAQRSQYLQIAESEAHRLKRLIDDLLELTRLERGQGRLSFATVRLLPLLDRARTLVDAPHGRTVEIDCPADVELEADGDRLLQIVTNLVGNGLRHGHGTVRVAAATRGDQVELTVADDGDGVPASRVPALFTPFASWSREEGSTGLGLSIARALAEAHGGSLDYRAADGERSHAFVLALPREQPATADEREDEALRELETAGL